MDTSPSADTSVPRVSVVCPFFNEEAIVANALRRMVANLERYFPGTWELILVDDGSLDNSVERIGSTLRELGQRGDAVRVLALISNQGRGKALKSGIDGARADIVVTTEVDCSWGDDIVQRLVAEMDEHPDVDVVVASPHLPGGGFENVPPSRVALSTWGNIMIRHFFNSAITMNTGMTRAYRAAAIKPLPVSEQGKEFHLEVLLKLLTIGFRVREIPAVIAWQEHKLAQPGAKKRKSSTRIGRTISSHLRFLAIAQPVRSFAWLAVSALAAAALFLLLALAALLSPDIPSIFFALVSLLLCVSGLILAGFSIAFFELREALRILWSQAYPNSVPPFQRSRVRRPRFDGR